MPRMTPVQIHLLMTSIFIKMNSEYLGKCIEFLIHFAKISELQCNLEKISVIPIDGNYNINDEQAGAELGQAQHSWGWLRLLQLI